MAENSKIEWIETTWNPITGCNKISPGCKYCYAEIMAKRLCAMGQKNYQSGFQVKLHSHVLAKPLTWKKPQTVFVNSMSDLFHEKVPIEFIKKTFDIMKKVNRHQYQLLTKRSERLMELDLYLDWEPNIWMGVSVENENYKFRIDHLRNTSAFIKFLSLEPLIGPLNKLDLTGIDWVIVGGESGPKARPMKKEWVTTIRDQCKDAEIPFFFKQWGGFNKKKNGRLLDGKIWS